MKTSKVVVRQEHRYGKYYYHPVSDSAKLFCQLIKRSGVGRDVAKSLTADQLGIIKALGHEVEVVAEVVAI